MVAVKRTSGWLMTNLGVPESGSKIGEFGVQLMSPREAGQDTIAIGGFRPRRPSGTTVAPTSARSSIWTERLTTDQKVGGSNPSGRATERPRLPGEGGAFRFSRASMASSNALDERPQCADEVVRKRKPCELPSYDSREPLSFAGVLMEAFEDAAIDSPRRFRICG